MWARLREGEYTPLDEQPSDPHVGSRSPPEFDGRRPDDVSHAGFKRKASFDVNNHPSHPPKLPYQGSGPPSDAGNMDLTPSERFLLNHEQFPKGPGNRARVRGTSPGRGNSNRAPPYPPPGKSGRPPLPPQGNVFALPPPKPAVEPPLPSTSAHPPPSVAPTDPSVPMLNDPIPTSIAEMARLIVELKATATLLDAQHSRLTIVARDPADWSLAIASLAKSIVAEQETLEEIRRGRAKAEDGVHEWEGVLQRNDVGIEERRGFVLDVLDMLDAGVLDQRPVSEQNI